MTEQEAWTDHVVIAKTAMFSRSVHLTNPWLKIMKRLPHLVEHAKESTGKCDARFLLSINESECQFHNLCGWNQTWSKTKNAMTSDNQWSLLAITGDFLVIATTSIAVTVTVNPRNIFNLGSRSPITVTVSLSLKFLEWQNHHKSLKWQSLKMSLAITKSDCQCCY